MSEIENLEARVKGIEGVKILKMDHEQLKTFVLTLNSKIIVIEKGIGNLRQILDEINDNYKGFRSGVAERYLSVEAYNNNMQGIINRIALLEQKVGKLPTATDNPNKAYASKD